MKKVGIFLLCMLAQNVATPARVPTFFNLDFEFANVPPGGQPSQVSTADGIPAWTAFVNGTPTPTIFYNAQSISGSAVTIFDQSFIAETPISGMFSVHLLGGFTFVGGAGSAAIAQTDVIPSDARSLLFAARGGGTIEVTFNGVLLPTFGTFDLVEASPFAVDLSGLAGQNGELRFTTPFQSGATIDDIRFSPEVVPEPSTIALAAVGGLALLLSRRFQRRNR